VPGIARKDLVGSWRLARYEAVSARDVIHPMGRNAVGVLDYSADGKVSVHIMGEGYFAYYGDYTIDGSTITHHLEMASEPTFVGASNVRHARLRGSTLVLSGQMMFDGAPRTIKVTWRRPRARRRKSARR
jgi:hypothetical protein